MKQVVLFSAILFASLFAQAPLPDWMKGEWTVSVSNAAYSLDVGVWTKGAFVKAGETKWNPKAQEKEAQKLQEELAKAFSSPFTFEMLEKKYTWSAPAKIKLVGKDGKSRTLLMTKNQIVGLFKMEDAEAKEIGKDGGAVAAEGILLQVYVSSNQTSISGNMNNVKFVAAGSDKAGVAAILTQKSVVTFQKK